MKKSSEKVTSSREELEMLIVEIEGMSSTRRSIYAESDEASETIYSLQNELKCFLQHTRNISATCSHVHDYLSPSERLASQTKLQVV